MKIPTAWIRAFFVSGAEGKEPELFCDLNAYEFDGKAEGSALFVTDKGVFKGAVLEMLAENPYCGSASCMGIWNGVLATADFTNNGGQFSLNILEEETGKTLEHIAPGIFVYFPHVSNQIIIGRSPQ